jgi:ribulose-5-phosphate 4-epimerase/fuculose-1-phosphate aldolase
MGGTFLTDTDETLPELTEAVAVSCRILGMTGCVREVTGHVSVRVPGADDMLIRSRRPDDPGVSYTTPGDIRRVDFDGRGAGLDEFGTPGTMGAFSIPSEYPIHSEVYRARPDVCAVVHAHPENSLLCGILDLPLLPTFGAYDPGALELIVHGIPVFDSSVLIRTEALGREVAATLGNADACLLRGHGVVTVGRDVYEATVRAIRLETLCELTLRAYSGGRSPLVRPDTEIDEIMNFVDRVSGTSAYGRATWEHYRHTLEMRGLGL